MSQRVVLLAHEKFPDGSKTANGIIRYGDQDVVAVLDRDRAGDRVADHLPGVSDAPVVGSFGDVEGEVDELIVGISPIGGAFDESWRPDVRAAIEAGCDVTAGLHYFLNDDEEFAALAADHGVTLTDVREPHEGLGVAEGRADEVSADVVLTVGTDCGVGKMTATMELAAAAEAAGVDACVVPTGQTGIMVEGWGNPVDRVVSDFTAGAVEEMVLERGDDHDLLIVEGQASIVHPAYSAVTCGILHGAMPDALVLCHEAGRKAIHGYEDTALPPIEEYVDLYESVAAPVHGTEVVAGALNTSGVDDDDAAREAVADFSERLGAPAADLVRFDAGDVVGALR
ncbi:DUF1611 domain-containing protein [Candidatus Halobonum tyrrellensis]|uniref:DUF1611 domain-containing protein n=1 Tax=Candidatus Halobonum tyrrellensis G22 TaxID=1324957 RepID=V4GSX2_9EURY|nr:DUF1611 domain-containing protein [Candidatus Halobonum tyrrellensis]ESP88201.1 hypothetical protein K933_10335 [Candidatus Halobonum tyrrellensis G22]